MHPDVFFQSRAKTVQAQDIHILAVHASDRPDLVALVLVDEGDFCRLGIVTKKRQIDVRQTGRPAMPDRPRQMWAKCLQAPHPQQRMLTQGLQLLGLGVRTKEVDVIPHLRLHLVVVRQRCSPRQTQRLDGTVLGLPKRQALCPHQPGGGGGSFNGRLTHALG